MVSETHAGGHLHLGVDLHDLPIALDAELVQLHPLQPVEQRRHRLQQTNFYHTISGRKLHVSVMQRTLMMMMMTNATWSPLLLITSSLHSPLCVIAVALLSR